MKIHMQLRFLMKKQNQQREFSSVSPDKNEKQSRKETYAYDQLLLRLHNVCLARIVLAKRQG